VDITKNRYSIGILRKKAKILQILFLFVLAIGFVWLVIYSKKVDKARFQKGDFAIGYIDKYSFWSLKGSFTGYYYHFSDNNKKYHYFNDNGVSSSIESWNLPPMGKKQINHGDMFLVMSYLPLVCNEG
jgi:hypothetical protein